MSKARKENTHVCYNKECDNHNDTFHPSENCCELFQDITDCEHYVDIVIVHDKCGLPVELCVCDDADIKLKD